ncbi:hypothetical protein [Arthrobacter alpinus]|nr:hypothetical protein [Arthrobacter alpinus]
MNLFSWGRKSVVAGTIVLLAAFLASCAPESMSTSEACRAYKDMYVNSPDRGAVSEAAGRYQVGYLLDFSKSIDGVLGDGFAEQADFWQQAIEVMSAGEDFPQQLHDMHGAANKKIWGVCGYPWE